MDVYTTDDDENLVSYISESNIETKERLNLGIYKDLVAGGKGEKWPWSRRHTAESWFSRYRTRQAYFDSRIDNYIQPKDRSYSSPLIAILEEAQRQSKVTQELFTEEDRACLVKFLANLPKESSHEPWKEQVYKYILIKNPKKFPWAVTHDTEAWRNLYLSHRDEFETEIANLRKRDSTQSLKRLLPEESEEESDIETQPAQKMQISPQPADPLYTKLQSSDDLKNYTSIQSTPPSHTQEENRSRRASLTSRAFTSTRSEGSSPTYDDKVSCGRHTLCPIASPSIGARGSPPHSELSVELEVPNGNHISQRLSSDEPISLPHRKPPALPKLKPKKAPSVPELSEEDPFASVPPSPKSTFNVFYKPPRPRSYAGFRDTARVRDRVIVNGPIVPMRKKQKISHIDRNQDDLSTTVGKKSDDNVSRQPTSANMKALLAARQSSAMTSMTREPQQLHLGKHDISKPTTIVKKALPDGIPIDVFSNQEATALTTTPDCYVLNTSHLKKPQTSFASSDSPSSSIPVGGVSQRDLKSRRRTFGGVSSGLPHINLLTKLPKRRTAGSSIPLLRRNSLPAVSKISHLIASDHKARPITYTHAHNELSADQAHVLTKLSPASYSLILGAGLDTLFKQLEENHGFSQEVIQRIWAAQNMDFHATDRMLLRMRIAAEEAAAQTDSEGETNRVPVAASSSSLRRERESAESVREPAEPRDEYTPPAKTKALKYQRLSEHKRHNERMEQELHSPQSVIPATTSPSHEQGSRNLVRPTIPPEVVLIEPKSKRRSVAMVRTTPEIVNNKFAQDMPPGKHQDTASVWGEKEEEALRTNEENKLKELAERFGESFLLQRFMADIGI